MTTKRRLVSTPIDWAACGTPANYAAHIRRGEQPCERCRLAHNRDRRRFGSARCHRCERTGQARGLCATHFRQEFGMTLHQYQQQRRRARSGAGV